MRNNAYCTKYFSTDASVNGASAFSCANNSKNIALLSVVIFAALIFMGIINMCGLIIMLSIILLSAQLKVKKKQPLCD